MKDKRRQNMLMSFLNQWSDSNYPQYSGQIKITKPTVKENKTAKNNPVHNLTDIPLSKEDIDLISGPAPLEPDFTPSTVPVLEIAAGPNPVLH